MKIYRGAIEVLEFTSDGREFRDLDTHEHSLSFSFELSTYVELKKGDRISYNGKNFYLPKDFIVEKNKSTDGYRYDLTFYDITRRFDDFILKFEGNTDFPLNATGADHLKLVSDNLYDAGIGVFSYSVIPDVKEIQYDNKTILEALDLIAETYELEWWLDGDTINLGICEFGEPVILEYDVELDEISFSEASEKMITRLYAFGGTRNMLYGKRLTLPPEHPYVDLFLNLPSEQIVEGVKIFDDIYPRQENTITEVTSRVIYPDDREHQNTTVFTFKCSGINVTQADLLPGQPLKMAFTSGQLNGREFEIIIPDDLSNGYEIKYEQEGDNYFPNPTLRPQVGDTFFFFGFRAETVMPELVTAAQNELFSAAQEYIDSLGIDYVFDVKTRSIYCEENNIDLGIGQIVTLKSDYLGTITSRIRSYEKNINNIFDATYSIGSYSRYSRISTIEKETGKKVDRDEIGDVVDNVDRISGDIQNMYLRFLSKVSEDTAQKLIKFLEGIEVGTFASGLLGSGAAIRNINGTTVAEVDQLLVRQRAEFFSVLIHEARSVGGQLIISAANMLCTKVEETPNFYRCYFDSKDGEVANLFSTSDFARCQIFTGTRQKFYWRKVVAVGTDYIELSKTDAALNSDIPEVGDTIFQLGSTDVNRQGAMILSTVGNDAPSFIQYSGINSYDLTGKETTKFTRLGNRIQGKTVITSGGSNLDDYLDATAQDIQDAQAAANAAALKAQQAIEDAEANVGLINTEVSRLQAQIDGEVSNWFYPYSPTLANYPASDWTTNEIKDRHIGDTFTNTQTFVDNATTPDAGKSWRFVKDGSTYSWTVIADSDAVKALLEASKAQATADGKSTTFLIQPTSYKLGDMWVLNADRTINGTAYKQGEILTATQDSETFNEAHWLKRVRYTDDTAVNELEIGGRNLLLNSKAEKRNSNYPLAIYSLGDIKPQEGEQVTIMFKGELGVGKSYFKLYNSGGSVSIVNIYNSDKGSDGIYRKTFNWRIGNSSNIRLHIYPIPNTVVVESWISEIMLVKGNKAAYYNEAPEDVQAEIDDAKQEALTAAGNAQTSANTANTAIENLNTYVDGSFKDGVIEASEAKAIEKYINIVNTEKSNLEATYNTLYANTYLGGTPKSDLLNAKVTYFGAVDTLLGSINTAISDGKTTTAEKNAVDSNYNSYKSALASLQTAIENANKAIQAKLDALSTEKVDNLEIGGRNLIIRSSEQVGTWINTAGDIVSTANHSTTDYIKVEPNKTYSFSKIPSVLVTEGIGGYWRYAWYDENKVYISRRAETSLHNFQWTIPNNAHYVRLSYPIDSQPKFEKGNKATDWTPAPEDIQAEIDDAKQEALTAAGNAQTTANSLKNFTDTAFRDGIIDRSESIAIEKYKNSLNEAMAKAEASYNKVYTNTYLEGAAKTSLLNAKINLWGQRDTLLSAINTAISGGITTPAQKTAVDNAFSTFNTLMAAFQNALEEANKAIQTKLDAISKGYVNDLEIGGRNLLLKSKAPKTGTSYNIGYWTSSRDFIIGEALTVTIKGNITGTKLFGLWFNGGSIGTGSIPKIKDGYYSKQLVVPAGVTNKTVGLYLIGNQTAGDNWEFEWIKLESGNKATDWTPAPEDIQYDYEAKIENAGDSISLAVYNKTLDALNPATELKLTSSSIKLTVADDIATAKSQAISAAATDATNKVNGLKADLSGTGIDIEAGILTLYSGAKGGNAGGKIIIAGDNFSVDANGKLKAVDGEFSGKITANEGTLGALTMQYGGYIDLPPSFTNRKGRLDNTGLSLIYDGANSQKIEWYSGMGTFAGQITCDSQGRLRLSSFFGIKLFVESLSHYPISITKSGLNHSVDFGSAVVANIRKLSSIGQLNMAYTTHALSVKTNYRLSTDTALIVITSAVSGAGIYRITNPGNSSPSDGDVKIIMNASTQEIRLKCSETGSNIKNQTSNNDYIIYANSLAILAYYDGYWRPQMERW